MCLIDFYINKINNTLNLIVSIVFYVVKQTAKLPNMPHNYMDFLI